MWSIVAELLRSHDLRLLRVSESRKVLLCFCKLADDGNYLWQYVAAEF